MGKALAVLCKYFLAGEEISTLTARRIWVVLHTPLVGCAREKNGGASGCFAGDNIALAEYLATPSYTHIIVFSNRSCNTLEKRSFVADVYPAPPPISQTKTRKKWWGEKGKRGPLLSLSRLIYRPTHSQHRAEQQQKAKAILLMRVGAQSSVE